MKISKNLLENELVLNMGFIFIVLLIGRITLYFIA
ncbi:MAG: hypothetical protein ACI9U5_001235 [Colwellia sp.]|jgi:hypothetical protein